MAEYISEQQQVEALKKWWQQNGKVILIGIAIGVGSIGGWRYWQDQRHNVVSDASTAYMAVLTALDNPPKPEDVIQKAEAIISEYPDTAYAGLAALAVARLKLEQGDTVAARAHLQWVREQAKHATLEPIARLRLARVAVQEKKYDEALIFLKDTFPADYQAVVAELKGDVYRRQGKEPEARTAYEEALKQVAEEQAGARTRLEMKRDDLAATGSGSPS